jgi:acetylornithine deacetylase/succinyl-diaminopimelate desuccinylase-like protein
VKIQRYLAEHDPRNYSVLRTSIVPTILKAGFRSNVIPSEGEATLDIRALPDEDMTKLYAEMRRVIADPAVEIVPKGRGGRQASGSRATAQGLSNPSRGALGDPGAPDHIS